MKLVDLIYEEDALGFKTTKTNIDPETGQITWDVEYTPLVKIDGELEKLAIIIKKNNKICHTELTHISSSLYLRFFSARLSKSNNHNKTAHNATTA